MSTTKTSDLAARLKATATGSRATSLPPVTPSIAEPKTAATTIQRFMVNLPKAQHRFIRKFALDNDTDVSTIVRSLLQRIEDDPAFAEEVRTHLVSGS